MLFAKYKSILSGLVVLASLTLSSHANSAQISYQGSLTNGVAVSGQVGNRGWIDDIGLEVDFWVFAGIAGQEYELSANRLDDDLDTAFSLYEGFVIADDSEFDHNDNFGTVNFIDSADDEITHPSGLFGDPFLAFTPTSSGIFTIAIGDYAGNGTGPYNYSLELNEVAAVPVPAAVWLFGSAIAGIIGFRRKRA